MEYQHTQRAPIHLLLHGLAAYFVWFGWMFRHKPLLLSVMLLAAAAFIFLGLCFRQLTVCDDGDALSVRFGPLPVFGKRIRYDTITAVEAGRSSLIDGWGIHYVPGRGWTYNLWGYDCVVVECGKRYLRIGSNDVPNLVEFLCGKIADRGGAV